MGGTRHGALPALATALACWVSTHAHQNMRRPQEAAAQPGRFQGGVPSVDPLKAAWRVCTTLSLARLHRSLAHPTSGPPPRLHSPVLGCWTHTYMFRRGLSNTITNEARLKSQMLCPCRDTPELRCRLGLATVPSASDGASASKRVPSPSRRHLVAISSPSHRDLIEISSPSRRRLAHPPGSTTIRQARQPSTRLDPPPLHATRASHTICFVSSSLPASCSIRRFRFCTPTR